MRLALLLALVLPLAACADDAAEADLAPVDPAEDLATAAPADAEIVKVNLNTTPEADFMALPDVGERMAHEFVEYRPYASIEQFRREIGKYVDAEKVAQYEEYVFVPVSVASADAETLRQLPGVGAAEAVRLIEGQPYADAEAFLDAYAAAVPAGDREAAATMLAE